MVLLATLQSRKRITGAIEHGIKAYQEGGIEISENESGEYIALVPQEKGETRKVTFRLTQDKRDVEYTHCFCTRRYKQEPLCCHAVAAILEVQGGVKDSPLILGKAASATEIVSTGNIASTVGSGSLSVYSMPSMVALMEKAAYACLSDCLEDDETSVGIKTNIEHTSISRIGTTITAEVRVEKVFGNRIEFDVSVYGKNRYVGKDARGNDTFDACIGRGTHTRLIVDKEMQNLAYT